jgi:hypothetical protein
MIIREQIVTKLERVLDEQLEETYKIIKNFEVKKEDNESNQSVMARLRQIRISATLDF